MPWIFYFVQRMIRCENQLLRQRISTRSSQVVDTETMESEISSASMPDRINDGEAGRWPPVRQAAFTASMDRCTTLWPSPIRVRIHSAMP